MSKNKGFSLIEIIITLTIITILASIAVPNYLVSIQQGSARAARYNLISIYNAQKNYFFNKGSNCITAAKCGTLPLINTSLAPPGTASLNINDNNFGYSCAADATGFKCTATNNSDAAFTVKITGGPIVTPGNPVCASDISDYCPKF